MDHDELVRHMKEDHHIDVVSVRLSDQPHLTQARAGGKGDLATYHEDIHDEQQGHLDHKHW
jgi:hypothetical protein